jgi:hypothetical protein
MTIEFLTREDYLKLDGKLCKIIELLSVKNPLEEKEWLKSGEVKSILGCSDATLKNYRDACKLPYSKIGGTYYYLRTEVERTLNQNHPTLIN